MVDSLDFNPGNDMCIQVVKSKEIPYYFRRAVDRSGSQLVAPWITALGMKTDRDGDGFDEFNVMCTGSILTNNIVIREALFEQQVYKCFFNHVNLMTNKMLQFVS